MQSRFSAFLFQVSLAFLLTVPGILLADGPLEVRKDIEIRRDTNQVRILKQFKVYYALPLNEKVLDVEATNYDFSKTSILMKLDSITNNQFTLTIQSFEMSNFTVPSVTVSAMKGTFSNRFLTPEISIEAIPVMVSNIQPAPMEDIYIIHDYLFWIIIGLIALGIGGVGVLIYFLLKKKPGTGSLFTPKVLVNPYEEAFTNLNELQKAADNGLDYKEIFVKVSEIIRRFIQRVYPIGAMEMATSEILSYFKTEAQKGPDYQELNEVVIHVFRLCDRVKYAKHIPDSDQIRTVMTESASLVEKSRRIFEPAAAEQNTEGGSK